MSPTLRRFLAEDADALVAIHERREPEGPPRTAARLREESVGERWTALVDGRVVGSGRFEPAWWTGDPHAFQVELGVDPNHPRQGIGTALWETLRERLIAHDARSLTAWAPDGPGNLGFAARHGFAETGQVIREFRLDTAHTLLDDHPDPAGLSFFALADLSAAGTEPFLRALQRLWADGGAVPADLDAWRRDVVDGPDLSLETHWVALDGERPVGMTFLRRLSPDAADNDYTGVEPAYRRRGIASALKRRAVLWARESGVRWFHTSSRLDNAPMITVNTRLGYRPGALRHEVARHIAS